MSEPIERKHICESAGFWFKSARTLQAAGQMAEALHAMENAYNHVENALVAVKCAELLHELEASTPEAALDNLRSIKRRFTLAQASAAKHHEGDRAACKRLDDFQNEVWGSLDRYSKALGWGLTGIQPECWTLLDAAINELVLWRGLRQERK